MKAKETDNLLKTAEALFKMKVTVQQVKALMHLLEGKKHLTKLAELMDLTVNGVTYHINQLRDSGHIHREGQVIKLTEKGRVYAKSLCAKVSFDKGRKAA